MITFLAVWFYFAGALFTLAKADGPKPSLPVIVGAIILWPVFAPIAAVKVIMDRE